MHTRMTDSEHDVHANGTDADLTSVHVRRAQAGEEESRAWIVARFSPLLRIQADYRLRGRLRRLYDPEDLVDEVWAVALPRLADLRARNAHLGPVLLKFLGTTLLHKTNNLLRRALRAGPTEPSLPGVSGSAGGDPLDRLPADVSGVLTRARRDEAREAVRAAIERLGPAEREVVVLRGIEQVSNQEAARALGAGPSTVAMRYRSALGKLRALLPDSVFDELPES
jgi:RNA polymerase sigma-70 factor (ECF subfamily)